MVIGQMQELDFQRVDYNGKIKQYAIVEEVGDTVFRYPCPDCTCTLTMSDSEGFVIKNSEPCTDEDNGLFTNILYENNLQAAQTYELRHYCISPTYGNGTVISYLKISSEETSIDFSASADDIATQISDITTEGCQRTENPSAILPDMGYYSCLIWQTITGLYNPLYDISNTLSGYRDEIEAGVYGFQTATAPARYAYNLVIGLYNDAPETIYGLVISFLGMFTAIFSAFGMFGLIYEMYVVFKVIGNPSGIGMVADFIGENVRLFSWIYDRVMTFLTFLANLIPGT